jgi:hypothetical protein
MMPILIRMGSDKRDQTAVSPPVPGDLAGSLASALLWLDVATLSLEREDLRDLKASLRHARMQLQAVARYLPTASDRRAEERRMRQDEDRRRPARGTADRRSMERRKEDRRTS